MLVYIPQCHQAKSPGLLSQQRIMKSTSRSSKIEINNGHKAFRRTSQERPSVKIYDYIIWRQMNL